MEKMKPHCLHFKFKINIREGNASRKKVPRKIESRWRKTKKCNWKLSQAALSSLISLSKKSGNVMRKRRSGEFIFVKKIYSVNLHQPANKAAKDKVLVCNYFMKLSFTFSFCNFLLLLVVFLKWARRKFKVYVMSKCARVEISGGKFKKIFLDLWIA